MDVLAREQAGLDAIGGRARLHERQRRLHRFGHHFAELAGGADLALARRGHGFDPQQFAADLVPTTPATAPTWTSRHPIPCTTFRPTHNSPKLSRAPRTSYPLPSEIP